MHQNGLISYYKDMNQYKGTIRLTKGTKVFKTARNQIEIPVDKKSYILIEIEQKRNSIISRPSISREDQNLVYPIDEWLEAMESVIRGLSS